MVHIIYGLVSRENFVVDEVCRIIKKDENNCYSIYLLVTKMVWFYEICIRSSLYTAIHIISIHLQ
jgi:hypothetical protein